MCRQGWDTQEEIMRCQGLAIKRSCLLCSLKSKEWVWRPNVIGAPWDLSLWIEALDMGWSCRGLQPLPEPQCWGGERIVEEIPHTVSFYLLIFLLAIPTWSQRKQEVVWCTEGNPESGYGEIAQSTTSTGKSQWVMDPGSTGLGLVTSFLRDFKQIA